MCVYIKLQQEISPISLFDANIGTETTAVIDRATAKPAEARTIYAKEYVDGNRYLAAASYDRAFNKYYEAGKKGMSFSDIKRSSRDIKADSARRIYEAGRRATENESKRQEQYKRTDEYKNRSKERTEQNTAAEKLGGVVREYSADKKISRSQRRQLKLFDVWAKKKGVVIRVVSSLAEKYKLESKIINGEYAGGNTIVIALDGKNALTSTAGHEMYHMIENLSPEYAQSFRKFVIDHLKAAGQYENVFKDYERRYGKAYARDESFKAKIDEEIVADHCFEAMTNKEQWDSFAAENKTLAEKIKDFILEFVAMINRAYDKYFAHDNAEIRNEVLGEIDYMNEIAKRLWEGVDKAVENYRFGAGTESETKFSINEIVDDDGNKYGIGVVLDSNLLEGLNQNERKQMVKERVVGELAGQQVIAYDKSGNAVEINFAQKGDKFKNKNGKRISVLNELYRKNIDKSIKQEAVVLADELVESAKYRESEKAKYSHDWLDNNGKNKWDYWDVYIQDKNKTVYVATLNVANTQNGSKILYDIDPIKKARGPVKSGPTIANINISQNDTDVNTHSMQNSKNNSSFSVSDSNGNQLSDSDRLNELQSEYRELEKKVDKIKASDEYKRFLDIISTGEGDALDEAVKEYGKFTHSSGLYAVTKRMSEITGEQKDLRAKIDSANEQSRDEFIRSVDDLTDRQKAEYAQKAVDTFGTTERVDLASYILTNGEMLDFSEGQGYRIKDHREISEILDMPDSAEYSDSLICFMNMGNIRMQTYGIDISAAPNAEQISRLRDVIPEIMKDNDEFSVDFSKKNGYSAGSVTYPKGTATSKILSDINEFFESGTVPVYESEYGEFRYSVSESFEDQIDSVLNNTFDKNNHIYMGNTPYSLQSILHLQNKPMLITPTHVYTMTVSKAQAKVDGRYSSGDNYHDLGKELLLKLPKALEKPLFLIKSTAKPDDLRVVAVTSLTDKNGVNVVAIIKPDGKGFYSDVELDSNFMLSGYGKDNILNYVLNAKKEGRILYASEKNNRLGKSTPGVQFPDTTFTADYNNSLSQYREAVNKYYAQNDKEYLSNSNKFKNFNLSDETKTSISDAGMRLTDDSELSSLLREQAYKAEIERLKGELVKSKRMGGKGKNRLVKQDVSRIARDIISEYSSKIDFSTLRDELTGLYELMDNIEIQGSADYAELVKLSNDIAKSVIASSYVDITDQSAEKYKAAMRSYRLTPSLQDVAELKDMFGTFGAAYRQYGKKLNMRAKGTENAFYIDEVWEDLCETVPLLDRNADSTQEMWRNLIEVRDSLDEKTGFNPYLEDGELSAGQAAAVLGADILERFNEVSPDTTFADRAQQRVDLRFSIVVMRVKIFSLTSCSDIINPSLNRTLSRNSLTDRPHTLSFHTILSSANKCTDSSV